MFNAGLKEYIYAQAVTAEVQEYIQQITARLQEYTVMATGFPGREGYTSAAEGTVSLHPSEVGGGKERSRSFSLSYYLAAASLQIHHPQLIKRVGQL